MNNRFFLFAIIIAILGIGFIACNDNNNDSKSKNLQTKLSPVSNREAGEMIVSYMDTDKTNNVFRFSDANNVFNWIMSADGNVIFDTYVSFEDGYFQDISIHYDSIGNNFSVYMEDGRKVTLCNFRDTDKNAVSFDVIGEYGTTPTIMQYDSLDSKALFFYLLNYNKSNKNGNNLQKLGPISALLIGTAVTIVVSAAATYVSCKLQQKTEVNKCYAQKLCPELVSPCGAVCHKCKN